MGGGRIHYLDLDLHVDFVLDLFIKITIRGPRAKLHQKI